MSNADRAAIAALIREHRRLLLADAKYGFDEELYDAATRLRGQLSLLGKPVRCDGRLYVSQGGELVVIDLATVEEVS